MDDLAIAVAQAVTVGLAAGVSDSTSSAFSELVDRIRARFSGRPALPSEDAENAEPTPEVLEAEFAHDPAFREEIRVLWGRVSGDPVVNNFSGQARTVVQARDIHGGFTVN